MLFYPTFSCFAYLIYMGEVLRRRAIKIDGLWLSIVSLVIGVVASIFVSRYYYRRTFKKSLTPYIQFYSSPFHGLDSLVRKQLLVKYQDQEISNLFGIQFLIANTGDKALRDFISRYR